MLSILVSISMKTHTRQFTERPLAPSYETTKARIQAIIQLLKNSPKSLAAKEAPSSLTTEEVEAILLYNDLNLPVQLFEELLAGFDLDAKFSQGQLPIEDEAALDFYCDSVASSVGEMCVILAWGAHGSNLDKKQKEQVIASAREMGTFQ